MTSSASRLRSQIDQVEESITDLESQLESLRSEKEQLLEDLHRLAYPILSLPCEITTKIFMELASDTSEVNPHNKCHDIWDFLAPFTVASVCGGWRSIALSTRALWSTVTLFCESAKRPVALLGTYFKRARGLPLDIWIEISGSFTYESDVLLILIEYSSQWRNLQIFRDDSLYFPIHHISSLPLLETLTLQGSSFLREEENAEAEDDAPPIILRAPRLRELSIGLPTPAIRTAFPLEQLTTLELLADKSEIADILDVLALTPNLESLALDCWESSEDAAYTVLTLPRLRTLELQDDSTSHAH